MKGMIGLNFLSNLKRSPQLVEMEVDDEIAGILPASSIEPVKEILTKA